MLQINYVTYNVCCADDILNPNTEHCDIIVLHSPENANDHQWFCYTRIIGIYHANVQYTGPGMKDYTPWQMDFLHVQWFEWVPQQDLHYLEAVRFVCMNDAIVFNFMDLADILRSCDLLLAFRFGRCHQGQIAMLPIVHDSEDWNLYYVNRYNMFACSLPLLIVDISDLWIIICCSGITGTSVLDIPTACSRLPEPGPVIHHEREFTT